MFTHLENRVADIVSGAISDVSVVKGLRSEDLDTPCVIVLVDSAENFNVHFTDVFRVNVSIRYEEHYADTTKDKMDAKFSAILSAFLVDDLVPELEIGGQAIFQAQVLSTSKTIEGDIFVNEIILEIISERDS